MAAAVLGSIVGGVLFAVTVGYVVIPQLPGNRSGLAELGAALYALDAGIFIGAAGALAIAFRDEPARMRSVTSATVLLPVAVVGVGAWLDVIDAGFLFPPLMFVGAPVLALIGRVIATGGTGSQTAD